MATEGHSEDGNLFVVDRKKDMVIAGGFNIYPREINEVPLPASQGVGCRGHWHSGYVSG